MLPLVQIWHKHSTLTCLVVVGIAVIAATAATMDSFIETNTLLIDTQRSLSTPIERSQSAPSATDILSWKTYRNEKYGFEFRYPGSWGEAKFYEGTVSKEPDQVYALGCEPKGQWFEGEFSANSRLGFGARSADFDDCTLGRGGILYDLTKFKIQGSDLVFSSYDGQTASTTIEKVVSTADGGVAYLFKNGYCEGCERESAAVTSLRVKNFSLIFFDTGYEYDVGAKILEDQILSTFRFIEPVDISTWKTYRNEQYGFEVRYPNSWAIPSAAFTPWIVDKEAPVFSAGDPCFTEDSGCSGDVGGFYPLQLAVNVFDRAEYQPKGEPIQDYAIPEELHFPDKEVILVAGLPATRYIYHNSAPEVATDVTSYVELAKDSKIYVFEFFYSVAGQGPGAEFATEFVRDNEEVLQKILSTFRFIEPIDTSTGSTPLTTEWKMYRNTKYGFEFQHPTDHTAWVSVDQKNEVLVPASPTSDSVAITETESQLFCCEPNNLFISIESGTESPRNWLTQHIGQFTTQSELKSIADTSFAGKSAVEMRGAGSIGSAYRVIVIANRRNLVVISQGAPTALFDRILATFKFTE